MTSTTLTPCPIGRASTVAKPPTAPGHTLPDGPCPTMLQPYRGRLTDGIAQHLIVVHGVEDADARAEAARWVKAGCRATR